MRFHHLTIPVVLALSACGGKGDYTPVPRPEAYPRIAEMAEEFDTVHALSVSLVVNRDARLVVKDSVSLIQSADVVYPREGVTVYITVVNGLSEPADMERAIDARLHRIDANLAGTPAQVLSVESHSAFDKRIVRATGTTSTPVQLLGTDAKRGILVTATAFMNTTPATPYDSIAPLIDRLADHLSRLIGD